MHKSFLPVLAAAAALTAAAPASADTLLTPAPAGSTNLAYGGGHLAWAQPEGDGFRLVVRDRDGAVSTPAIAAFETAPDPAIGTVYTDDFRKILYVVFERDGDIKRLDLTTGRESSFPGAATRAYRESAPSLNGGMLSFVRSGGRRNGVYALSGRSRKLRRISTAVARETATNGTRVAYVHARGITIRRISGEGRALTIAGAGLRSVGITRYQAAWVAADGRLQRTDRFAGSGGPYSLRVRDARGQRPGVVSLAIGESTNTVRFLDAEGVKAGDPTILR